MALLFMLPAGVRWLELDVSPCAGPMLPALARFSQLEELTISGDASGISWRVGTTAALLPLRAICLDYRKVEQVQVGVFVSDVERLPASTQRALSAANGLRSFELRVTWSDEVAQLCRALPALRSLR